jgi:ATP-dependent Clp protease ATP-binding subunit ClpA
MDRAMPDKAIDVLDEAGATTNVNVEKPEEIKILEIQLIVLRQLNLNIQIHNLLV